MRNQAALFKVPPGVYPRGMKRLQRWLYCLGRTSRLPLGLLLVAGIVSGACTLANGGSAPGTAQPVSAASDPATAVSAPSDHPAAAVDMAPPVADASAASQPSADSGQSEFMLGPLVTDPPASARAARATDATYATYEGLVCGVVPRPEYGYTVRYPKIWTAREQGGTTWLADYTDDNRLVGVVEAADAPSADEDLARALADGWRARKLYGLRLEPVHNGLIGGQPAARWDVQFRSDDGTPMVGYAAATLANGHLYRVEIALPATRHDHLARAAAIVAEQLMITAPHERS